MKIESSRLQGCLREGDFRGPRGDARAEWASNRWRCAPPKISRMRWLFLPGWRRPRQTAILGKKKAVRSDQRNFAAEDKAYLRHVRWRDFARLTEVKNPPKSRARPAGHDRDYATVYGRASYSMWSADPPPKKRPSRNGLHSRQIFDAYWLRVTYLAEFAATCLVQKASHLAAAVHPNSPTTPPSPKLLGWLRKLQSLQRSPITKILCEPSRPNQPRQAPACEMSQLVERLHMTRSL